MAFGDVIRTLPPVYSAYPVDLAFDGKYLWFTEVATDRVYQLSTDGDIVRALVPPAYDPYGIAFDGKTLWLYCNLSGLVYQVDRNMNVIRSFANPCTGVPLCMCFDGKNLCAIDYNNGILRVLDVNTLSIVRSVTLRANDAGVAFDGKNFYITNFLAVAGNIYQMDVNGNVLRSATLPQNWNIGLAWDGIRLYQTTQWTDRIYYLDV